MNNGSSAQSTLTQKREASPPVDGQVPHSAAHAPFVPFYTVSSGGERQERDSEREPQVGQPIRDAWHRHKCFVWWLTRLSKRRIQATR